MNRIILIGAFLTNTLMLFGQNQPNVFLSFAEFEEKKPSEYVDFKLKHRTEGDVFMAGGVTNYRIKKVLPSSQKERMIKEVWGVLINDTVYINSYPYANMFGYDKIIEKGYYTFFIAQPSYSKKKQIELGIINEDEKVKQVCCTTGYVIMPDGTVKWLNPELLKTLIADNKKLMYELELKDLNQENVYEMFDIIRRYNKSK